ncbi:MAG: nuclear transport factor 2 family protein [Dehalococcoidales bacterium]|jgi:hypothetical protein
MTDKELEVRVKTLEKELQRLKDIEAITRLQRIYGYYLTTFMNDELISLFSESPETSLEWPEGTYLGKSGVKISFGNSNKDMNPEFMHQLMQIQGVIDVAEDGKTARGRWWGFGAMAMPKSERINQTPMDEGVAQAFACGVYENEYIKEDGIWKMWKIKWVPLFRATPVEGWVKPERLAQPKTPQEGKTGMPAWWKPDLPPKGIDYEYPSGYILPFHFKHPVTGKASTEEKRNVRVKGVKK